MINKHKNCKRIVKRKLERISFLLDNLRDMYHDDCPAIPQRMAIGYAICLVSESIGNLRYIIEITRGMEKERERKKKKI